MSAISLVGNPVDSVYNSFEYDLVGPNYFAQFSIHFMKMVLRTPLAAELTHKTVNLYKNSSKNDKIK